jgi:hypothetical protein
MVRQLAGHPLKVGVICRVPPLLAATLIEDRTSLVPAIHCIPPAIVAESHAQHAACLTILSPPATG